MYTDRPLVLGALCALNEVGIRVPRATSVVGFDDIAVAAYATPPLTTVRQPVAQSVRHVVSYVLDLVDGDTLHPSMSVRLRSTPGREGGKHSDDPA